MNYKILRIEWRPVPRGVNRAPRWLLAEVVHRFSSITGNEWTETNNTGIYVEPNDVGGFSVIDPWDEGVLGTFLDLDLARRFAEVTHVLRQT